MNKFKSLIAIVILIAVIWTGGWFYGTTFIAREMDQLATTGSDPQITCADRSITGFPFRYDVNCNGATIISGDDQIDIANVKATVRIYRPTHIIGFASAPLDWQNEFTGSKRILEFDSAQFSGRLSWGLELERISAVINGLVWSDNLFGKIELANAKSVEAHLIATQNADQGIEAYFKATGANLLELAITGSNLKIEAELAKIDRHVASWQYPTTLRQWQNDDGRLIVHTVDFEAKDLAFTANGELTLDQNGLLNGRATTQSKGLVELFDPEAYGLLAPTIFGVANADGEYKSLWTANAGTVSIGVAPLFFVPALF